MTPTTVCNLFAEVVLAKVLRVLKMIPDINVGARLHEFGIFLENQTSLVQQREISISQFRVNVITAFWNCGNSPTTEDFTRDIIDNNLNPLWERWTRDNSVVTRPLCAAAA